MLYRAERAVVIEVEVKDEAVENKESLKVQTATAHRGKYPGEGSKGDTAPKRPRAEMTIKHLSRIPISWVVMAAFTRRKQFPRR